MRVGRVFDENKSIYENEREQREHARVAVFSFDFRCCFTVLTIPCMGSLSVSCSSFHFVGLAFYFLVLFSPSSLPTLRPCAEATTLAHATAANKSQQEQTGGDFGPPSSSTLVHLLFIPSPPSSFVPTSIGTRRRHLSMDFLCVFPSTESSCYEGSTCVSVVPVRHHSLWLTLTLLFRCRRAA